MTQREYEAAKLADELSVAAGTMTKANQKGMDTRMEVVIPQTALVVRG